MRWAALTTLVIGLIVGFTIGAAWAEAATIDGPAPARADRRPCFGPRLNADEPGIGAAGERRRNARIIRCVFGRVARSQTAKALSVARCESGLNDEASNGGAYLGLFQHARRYWPGRARALPTPPFGREPGAFLSQANAWAAARLVRSSGWDAWGCA